MTGCWPWCRICARGVLERIAAAGVPPEGLLVDKDHFSLDDDHPSEAMGWLRELALCEGDLAGYIQWTSVGLPLIKGRVWRSVRFGRFQWRRCGGCRRW